MEIKGIELFMQSVEFVNHCAKRAEFHTGRAKAYLEKADDLRKMRRDNPNPQFDDSEDVANYGKSTMPYRNDPVTELEKTSASHRAKSERFRFMADHAVKDATYRLGLADLSILEIGV